MVSSISSLSKLSKHLLAMPICKALKASKPLFIRWIEERRPLKSTGFLDISELSLFF
jgi:hypothetical protein